LAGFVMVEPEASVSAKSLLEELSRILPRQMLPNPLTLLPEMPRLPSGKLDRNALRQVAVPEITFPIQATPPATATEALLCAIWEDLLGEQGFGTRQSFFALGGHSMSAIRLVTRVAAETGLMLPLRAIFEHPTVATLAAHIDSGAIAARPIGETAEPILRIDRSRVVRFPSVASHEHAAI